MMRSIVLHGALKEEFGASFPLDVASPAEAIRALCIMVKGFKEHLREGAYAIVRGKIDEGLSLKEDGLKIGLGQATELHIVPIAHGGSWFSEHFSFILGITLLAATFIPGLAPIMGVGLGVGGLTVGSVTVAIGASLALHGVAQMLAPAPQTSDAIATIDQRQSFLFGGLSNVSAQGGPVPLVIGKMRVGSVEVSVGVKTEQLGLAGAFGTSS